MIGIVFATHQPLGWALAEATRHVFGQLVQFAVVDVIPDTPVESLHEQMREAVAQVDTGDGVLVLTDLFGATPSNVASSMVGTSIKVVAGVNLPMILRAVSYRAESLSTAAEKAVTGGVQGVVQVGNKAPQQQGVPSVDLERRTQGTASQQQ